MAANFTVHMASLTISEALLALEDAHRAIEERNFVPRLPGVLLFVFVLLGVVSACALASTPFVVACCMAYRQLSGQPKTECEPACEEPSDCEEMHTDPPLPDTFPTEKK